MRTAVFIAATAAFCAIGLAGTTSGIAVFVACDPAALHLRLFSLGEATQVVTYLRVSRPAFSGCAVRGRVVFTIRRRGQTLGIKPLSVPVNRRPEWAMPEGEYIAHFWWSNWCGPGRGTVIEARYHGQVVAALPGVLPACVQPDKPSVVYRPPPRSRSQPTSDR